MAFDGSIVYWKGDFGQKVGRARTAGVLNVRLKEFIWNNNQCYQFLPGFFLEPPI